jgi:hypothetical protein
MKKNYFLFTKSIFLVITLFVNITVFGQQRQITTGEFSKQALKNSKVDGGLLRLEKLNSTSKRTVSGQSLDKLIQVEKGFVAVDITAKDKVESLIPDLKKLGMKDYYIYGRMISCKIPIQNISGLSSLVNLKYARPAYKPKTNVGSVTSQGDVAQRSDVARKTYNVKGRGVKVGVLSDSYNALNGADSLINIGDLPGTGNPKGYLTNVDVLKDSPGTDEGRAMLEIIHDVAPSAELAFHTANGGQAAFANGILALQKAGSDVIVDDIIYFAEPFFEDGIVAQAVDEVVAKGATYFSAAGNQGRYSYEASFRNSGIEPFGPDYGVAHDFGGGDIFQEITIPKEGTLLLILQWDDPFYSVSGNGAKSDIDFFLLNDEKDSILTGSIDDNIGNDPIEGFYFENTGEETTFNIVITKSGGPAPKIIKYIDFEGYISFNEFNTSGSTIFGHSNAKGAIAVGAVRYNRTPAFGVNPPIIEAFSSAGGTKIYFNSQGKRKNPEIRHKPEITAPNGGNSTFFIPGLDYEGDGFPNFFGTSASAPHAAGVAALILNAAAKSSNEKADVEWALKQSAIDMDDPLSDHFDVGFDYVSGYGFVQADLAIAAALRGKKKVNYLALYPTCSDDPTSKRQWKIKNPNPFSVNVTANVLNSDENIYVLAKPGETFFSTKAIDGLNLVFLTWKNENNDSRVIANVSFGEKCKQAAIARTEPEDEQGQERFPIVKAYPNPVVDKLTIQLLNTEIQDVELTLINPQGQKIQSRPFNFEKGEDEINMMGLPKGLYLLKVKQGYTFKVVKILKQ